jgi:hypothetical protein
MIPATVPCYARYQFKITDKAGNEQKHFDYRRVHAWNDIGRALIAPDNRSGELEFADSYRAAGTFVGLSDSSDHEQVVTLIPAGGWRIEYTDDDGATISEPLVGWGLREDGSVVPLTTDSAGLVDDLDDLAAGKWRIYHDDQRDTPAGEAS